MSLALGLALPCAPGEPAECVIPSPQEASGWGPLWVPGWPPCPGHAGRGTAIGRMAEARPKQACDSTCRVDDTVRSRVLWKGPRRWEKGRRRAEAQEAGAETLEGLRLPARKEGALGETPCVLKERGTDQS